ncbi:hypothetical protein BKA63DRAFT_578661 [Paraphoma chrysanthemicola]|nr:hypothetical protein BKA63DRAFT_578661 [Paraphoma chrysanthemicola]
MLGIDGEEEVKEWPGTDIVVGRKWHEEAAQALIGSPNGLGAAYLLLQHKKLLGGAKTISKIKIWRSEAEDHEEPNINFYVGDVSAEKTAGGTSEGLGEISDQ